MRTFFVATFHSLLETLAEFSRSDLKQCGGSDRYDQDYASFAARRGWLVVESVPPWLELASCFSVLVDFFVAIIFCID